MAKRKQRKIEVESRASSRFQFTDEEWEQLIISNGPAPIQAMTLVANKLRALEANDVTVDNWPGRTKSRELRFEGRDYIMIEKWKELTRTSMKHVILSMLRS